ncbi:sucrase ferredoxin [Deinococcus sp. YIM 77859]|uniref:sucrase ferredoxin n=1 Tax=Deinococcus sp. YIM 77859 TaxID=1540221 RepID=UPI000556BA38|nr:sucrase ferredoxin [Deinococcus sp. YIM 77859]
MTASSSKLPLCADVSRALAEDPIGTAPHWAEVTVLELDVRTWAQLRDFEHWTPEQQALFAQLRDKVEASGAGFGLLMSAPAQREQPLRVRHYTLAGNGYVRRDYASTWPQQAWARGLRDTLLEPANLRHWQPLSPPDGPDLHVCTHGSVDAACGKYGVPVHHALQQAGLRSWRTGHFGGHRFAATAVELPSGLWWAHLSPELAVRVARREVSPAEVRGHLRGYAGLPPRAQVLDREVLVRYGWDWLTAHRQAEVNGERVTLTYSWRGHVGRIEADVSVSHTLHLPGSSHHPERSDVPQYELSWLG